MIIMKTFFFLCRDRGEGSDDDWAATHASGSAKQNWHLHQVFCECMLLYKRYMAVKVKAPLYIEVL